MNTHKHITLLLTGLLLLSGTAMKSQEKGQQPDTTRIQFGDVKVLVIDEENSDKDSTYVQFDEFGDEKDEDEQLTHWGGIDLGVNFLLNKDGEMNFEGDEEWLDINNTRSLNWSFNVYEQKIKIVKNYVGIITGVGIGYSSYTFRDSVRLSTSGINAAGQQVDSLFAMYDPTVEYTKNKLRVSQLKVPLLLEFNTSLDNDRSFHLSGGVVGNWNFSNVYKRKFDQEDKNNKDRTKGDFHVRDISLDAMARIGYGDLTLFAQYGLLSLFEEDLAPEVYPVTVGLSIVPW